MEAAGDRQRRKHRKTSIELQDGEIVIAKMVVLRRRSRRKTTILAITPLPSGKGGRGDGRLESV